MAAKHSNNEKKSKAPVVIIFIASIIVVAAAVVGVWFFVNSGSDNVTEETTQVVATTIVEETETTSPSVTIPVQPTTVVSNRAANDGDHSSSAEETTVAIAVPTEEDKDVTYFNATFIPNGTVVDTYTGKDATLREVFGSGYNTDGVITFNSDGTFTDSVATVSPKSGAYAVQNEEISATYSDDQNMEITVIDWDGDTPVSFYINYAGYNVYFGESNE